jgi:hypothetical protein
VEAEQCSVIKGKTRLAIVGFTNPDAPLSCVRRVRGFAVGGTRPGVKRRDREVKGRGIKAMSRWDTGRAACESSPRKGGLMEVAEDKSTGRSVLSGDHTDFQVLTRVARGSVTENGARAFASHGSGSS